MEVGVRDAAARLGVSERRVRSLIAADRVLARKVAGRYLIDEAQLARSPAVSRPMSYRTAWAFIALLSGESTVEISPTELARLRRKLARLGEVDDPARLLRSWLIGRAEVRSYSATPDDLAALADDDRVVASGISDPRAELSSAGEFEGYVAAEDLDAIIGEFLFSTVGPANVRLHLHRLEPSEAVPLGVVLADLADHQSAREQARVAALLRTGPR